MGIWRYISWKVCISVIYTYEPVAKFPVYTDTVGQFIGILDRNGKEIYEGDIVIIGNKNNSYIIERHETRFVGKQNGTSDSYIEVSRWKDKVEVVGNIYDNPDLLMTLRL